MPVRVGIVGYGFIGAALADRIAMSNGALELAFVYNRTANRTDGVEPTKRLADLAGFEAYGPDLIVETSHPVVTREHGAAFLALCDYMPLSTTALLDDALRQSLLLGAAQNGNRLLLPAGALIGGHELLKRQTPWKHVKITFRKNPRNIDFGDSDAPNISDNEPVVIFDAPVRSVAARFPRNVNTMVTCALLSTGLDECQGVLIADPSLDCAVAELEAWDCDGGYFKTEKRQPVVGVSGTEMVDSVWYSIERAAGLATDSYHYV